MKVAVGLACAALVAVLAWPLMESRLRPHLVEYLARNLDEQQSQALYDQIAADSGALWDAIPEPLVNRLAKRNVTDTMKQAVVRTNNAGMRSSRPYVEPAADVFRVVCLGDSFVFGTGAPEQDRFADQIEEFYRQTGTTVQGRRIEVLALGLEGWTAVQEATYLASRISHFAPDVILLLSVANDITDSEGIAAGGIMTRNFSPEHRDWGSGVFSNVAGLRFGHRAYSALTTDICPEARSRWDKAMLAIRRLVDLQHGRGGKIVLALLNTRGTAREYFQEIYLERLGALGISAPYFLTSYFSSDETRLPHDPHPNRAGHAILANHFINVLDQLGWISVADGALPEQDPRLPAEMNPAPDPVRLAELRGDFVETILRPALDFSDYQPADMGAFLGGLFPEVVHQGASGPPWASIRSGFLLRSADGSETRVVIEMGIEPLPELFPFEVAVTVNGRPAASQRFETPGVDDRYLLVAPIPKPDPSEVIEVLLATESYFTRIADHRMRSFKLLAARLE